MQHRNMKYEGRIYRPPSEADSLILQATIGCSWNHCTYCAMYRDKEFRARPLKEILEDIEGTRLQLGPGIRRVFVADGDALTLPMTVWRPLLLALGEAFPHLQRVSCYATARNVLAKSKEDLIELRQLGLRLVYLGPESGDDATLKAIAKGATFVEHVEAAERLALGDIHQSSIFLLGVAGKERSQQHASASARLATEMNPRYLSLLTVTVLPNTPLRLLEERGRYAVPSLDGIMNELRTFVAEASPQNAVFRSNHASNYLLLSGRLPRDRDRLLCEIDAAVGGMSPLREEYERGL